MGWPSYRVQHRGSRRRLAIGRCRACQQRAPHSRDRGQPNKRNHGRRGTSRRPPAFASTAYGDRVASVSATGMDAGALLRELRGRADRAENTHMGAHGVAKQANPSAPPRRRAGGTSKACKRNAQNTRGAGRVPDAARRRRPHVHRSGDLPELMDRHGRRRGARMGTSWTASTCPSTSGTSAARGAKACETGRRLIFLDVRSARAARREYPI